MNFGTIQTLRLILRPYGPQDLEPLYGYLSDPEVVRYEPYRPMTRAEAERTLAERMASEEFLAVELRATGVLIGNLYLGPRPFEALELGYVFARPHWGQGYAAEACRAALQAAFAAGVHRVYAECDPENTPSRRLLERLGFAQEGLLRQNVYFWRDEQGRPLWKDTCLYAILAPDGPENR